MPDVHDDLQFGTRRPAPLHGELHALFGRERRALPGRATDKHAAHAALDQIFCLPRDHVEIDGSIPVHCSKRCSDEAGQMDGAIGAQWKASLATSVSSSSIVNRTLTTEGGSPQRSGT